MFQIESVKFMYTEGKNGDTKYRTTLGVVEVGAEFVAPTGHWGTVESIGLQPLMVPNQLSFAIKFMEDDLRIVLTVQGDAEIVWLET